MTDNPFHSEIPRTTGLPSPDASPDEHWALDTETSRTLHRRLARMDSSTSGGGRRLAGMYLGAKMVRRQEDNPERFAQAAHSIRDLIDELPKRFPQVPIFDYPDLISRVRKLVEEFGAYHGSAPEKRDHFRRRFELAMRQFAQDMEGVLATRREQAEALINSMDPSGRSLPPPIADQRTEEWRGYRAYFVKVCHHGGASPEEFDQTLDSFETFLVDRLGLRAFRSQATLQALISEGEGRA